LTCGNTTGSPAPATCWPGATRRWCCNEQVDFWTDQLPSTAPPGWRLLGITLEPRAHWPVTTLLPDSR
jgi:hypothetical protein